MASKGTFTALQHIRPITTSFGDLVKEGQDLELANERQKLAEKTQKDANEIARRKLKLEEDKAFEDRYGIDDSAILKTGFNSYDELMLPYAQSIKDEMWNVKEQLRNNPDNIKLKQKFSNLTNSVNTIKASNTAFSGLLNKYSDLQSKNGVSGVHEDKWLDLLQKYKDYKVMPTIDKNTGLTTMVYEDHNGDKRTINLQDMIDGNIPIYGKIDVDKLAGSIADGLGVRTKDSVTGRFINTEVKFEDVKDAAELAVRGKLHSDEELADILNQANGSLRDTWDVSTEEGRKEREKDVNTATKWMMSQIEGSYDTKDTLKERPYPPVVRPTASAIKDRQRVIDRNQTLANAKEGDVEQLKGRPAWDTDSNGKRIEVIIDDAIVTDNKLILSLSNGNSQEIDISRKSALNEIYNKATGIKVDTDMLDKIPDVSATKTGDIFESGQVPLNDSDLSFIDEIVISKEESDAESLLKEGISSLGFKVRQASVGKNELKISDESGNKSIRIKTGIVGEDAKKEVERLKKFLIDNYGTREGFVKKETSSKNSFEDRFKSN